MANKLYTENSIQNIADAIRYKNNLLSATYRVSDMAQAILNLPSDNVHLEVVTQEQRNASIAYDSTYSNIGSYAFQRCSLLTSVSFPECTTIGNSAFQYCSSLTDISFPKCILIGTSAFYSCSSLTEANFPECTSIDDYAFFSMLLTIFN
jgi:hypothetical protein